MTPHQLFPFAKADIPSVNFCFATTEEYEQEIALLSSRFESTLTVGGTHKLHCIHPMSTEQVEVKTFSNSHGARVERVLESGSVNVLQSVDNDEAMKFADLKGYITAKYDGHWWCGCVMQTFAEQNEVEINFLHQHEPA